MFLERSCLKSCDHISVCAACARGQSALVMKPDQRCLCVWRKVKAAKLLRYSPRCLSRSCLTPPGTRDSFRVHVEQPDGASREPEERPGFLIGQQGGRHTQAFSSRRSHSAELSRGCFCEAERLLTRPRLQALISETFCSTLL